MSDVCEYCDGSCYVSSNFTKLIHAEPHYRLAVLSDLLASLRLAPGTDCSVRLGTWYPPTSYRGHSASVEVEVDFEKMLDEDRRWLKRHDKFEVPSWATDMPAPPLEGRLTVTEPGTAEHPDELTVSFGVRGAFVCEQVGVEEVEPSEYAQKRAAELSAMTIEQILAEHAEKVVSLSKPKTKPRYRCRPNS